MSLRHWLERPLSRFLRLTWMGRIGLFRPVSTPRGPKTLPQRAPRPRLEGLESRETPDDLFGILAGGVSVGGLGMLLPPSQTPQSALLDGYRGLSSTPVSSTPVLRPSTPTTEPATRPASTDEPR